MKGMRVCFNNLILKVFCIVAIPILFSLFFIGSSAAQNQPEEELYFTILHTNDEHGSVIPHSPAVDFHPERDNPTIGGYSRLATAVREMRQRKDNSGEPVVTRSPGLA